MTNPSPTGSGAEQPPFVVSRTVDAPRDLVFRVWTEADHLARWFGPKGFAMFACTSDPRPGGTFHYGMRSPDGHEMWGKWVFREVARPERLVFLASFADSQGNTIRAPFSQEWPLEVLSTVEFAESGGQTTVSMTGVPENATDAERRMFGGFHDNMSQGWAGTFEQLEAYLARVR